MPIGPRPRAAAGLDVLRHVRDAARRRQPVVPSASVSGRYDSWLVHCAGAQLARIDAACAGGGSDCLAYFRELDADLWALLLTQEYDAYPNLRAALPSAPEPALQQIWNGISGAALASQGAAFYRRLCERRCARAARPPEYLEFSELMHPVRETVDPGAPRYLFVPHAADPSHAQYGGGEMTYGEAVVTLPYVRERWSEMFALLDVDLLLDDLFRVMLTLRRV